MRRLAPLPLAALVTCVLAACPAPPAGPLPIPGPSLSPPSPPAPVLDGGAALEGRTGVPATRDPLIVPTPDPNATPTAKPAAGGGHNSFAADQAACKGLAGAGTALTAAAKADEAPMLALDRRYDLTVGPEGGYVRVEVPTPGEWSLFMDEALLVIARDPGDEVVPTLEEGTGSDFCAAIKAQRAYFLDTQRRYTLDFPPRPGASAPLRVYLTATHPAH